MTVNRLTLPAKDNAIQSKVNEIIDNLTSSSDVFIATYGTTTYQEVLTAYNAEKQIFVIQPIQLTYTVEIYTLTSHNPVLNPYFEFVNVKNTSNIHITLLYDNSWSAITTNLASLSMPSDSANMVVIASSAITPSVSLPNIATDYTATTNGYAYLYMQFTSGYVQLNNTTAGISTILNSSGFGNFSCIPVQKGQTYRYNPGNAANIGYWLFYFIKCEGDI